MPEASKRFYAYEIYDYTDMALRTAPVGLSEPGEHPGSVRSGVISQQPDRVGGFPVAKVDCALTGSERGRQAPAARLVAHV